MQGAMRGQSGTAMWHVTDETDEVLGEGSRRLLKQSKGLHSLLYKMGNPWMISSWEVTEYSLVVEWRMDLHVVSLEAGSIARRCLQDSSSEVMKAWSRSS